MSKLMFAAFAAALVLSASAEEVAAQPEKKVPKKVKPTAAKIAAFQMHAFGGYVFDMRQQRGNVTIVNAQSAASEQLLAAAVKPVSEMVHIPMPVEKGAFDIAAPKIVGAASVFVVDSPTLPISLVAPEARWALVNVAPLKTDKPAFFEARVKKSVTRALAYLLGAAESQFKGGVLSCAVGAEGLDSIVSQRLPLDVITRISGYAPGYGITPYKLTKYKDAVAQGWAPQPTNEWQKAIWDKTRELPSNPIKIEYDPKREK